MREIKVLYVVVNPDNGTFWESGNGTRAWLTEGAAKSSLTQNGVHNLEIVPIYAADYDL